MVLLMGPNIIRVDGIAASVVEDTVGKAIKRVYTVELTDTVEVMGKVEVMSIAIEYLGLTITDTSNDRDSFLVPPLLCFIE